MVLALELCSLHLQLNDTVENVVSSALFADGAREDVTAWTVFTAADPAAVELTVSEDGRRVTATVLRPGQHVVIARSADLASYVRRLGEVADRIADEDPLLAPSRVIERLRL